MNNLIDFPIGSNGWESIQHFRIFAVDRDDEIRVQFVDSDAEGEIVLEEVESDADDYPEKQHVEEAAEHDVNEHYTDQI